MFPRNFLHENREEGCIMVGPDRKYYHTGTAFIKRSLRRHEWTELCGQPSAPSAAMPHRYRNDAAIVRYLRQHTDIPLPEVQCVFEDDGAVYLVSTFIEGTVNMGDLADAHRRVVEKELLRHVATLKTLRSNRPGVPGQSVMVPPQRVVGAEGWGFHAGWRGRDDLVGEFVFCHNDLAMQNVLVDPRTLKIKAIIDWEFGGFWPEWFEQPFWRRQGRSHALGNEHDDTRRCREWLEANCERVDLPHLPTLEDKLAAAAAAAAAAVPGIAASDYWSDSEDSDGEDSSFGGSDLDTVDAAGQADWSAVQADWSTGQANGWTGQADSEDSDGEYSSFGGSDFETVDAAGQANGTVQANGSTVQANGTGQANGSTVQADVTTVQGEEAAPAA